jgi:hypothetical protein
MEGCASTARQVRRSTLRLLLAQSDDVGGLGILPAEARQRYRN